MPKLDAYKVFGQEAKDYGAQYEEADFTKRYPEHVFRLKIFLKLLSDAKARRVLDVGCGSGEPLLAFLRAGYDAHGFDYSAEMVEQAQKLLLDNGLDPNRVRQGNMEEIQDVRAGEFDCIVGLGSLYYTRKFQSVIQKLAGLLPADGHLIFSLRNELFSMFSLNAYTENFFLQDLVPTALMSDDLRQRFEEYLARRFRPLGVERKFLTVDDKNVQSTYHNPLTIEKEVLRPNGLLLDGISYYHYHALPPEFEHSDTEEFRRLSAELENPSDWRGAIMCSTFVVDARRVV